MTVKSKGCRPFAWKITKGIKRQEVGWDVEFRGTGVCGFNFKCNPKKLFGPKRLRSRIDFHQLLIHLWPGNWREQLKSLNRSVREENNCSQAVGKTTFKKEISPSEFWVVCSVLFAARVHDKMGSAIWNKHQPGRVAARVDFSERMKRHGHDQIKKLMEHLFAEEGNQDEDKWWQISAGVKGFNANCLRTVWSSVMKVFDKSMSAFRPRTAKMADLPHVSSTL